MDRPATRRKHMPHVKQRCHRCRGAGRAPCDVCRGTGQLAKSRDVYGKPVFGSCEGCFGAKTRRCTACAGTGFA